MAKYRDRVFMVEATQWHKPGDHPAVVHQEPDPMPGDTGYYKVLSLQGWSLVHPGDWIIEEPDGSGHYPCSPDLFAKRYELINEDMGEKTT